MIEGVDPRIPNAARIYDYFLGGKDNYAADRKAAETLLAVEPETQAAVRENRRFLGRAVRYLTERGIRQFIDLGTGLPTMDNVHQIAQEDDPDARVVYVDHDPVVCVHARALLEKVEGVTTLHADLRRPGDIIDSDKTRSLIDFSRPMAVLMVAVLHFIPDEEAYPAVARFRDVLPAGSYLAISHITGDVMRVERPESFETLMKIYDRSDSPLTPRPLEQIGRFFDGFEFVDPGLVSVADWRSEGPSLLSERTRMSWPGGVARKP